MHNSDGFRSTLLSLWLRLVTLAIIGCVFYQALVLVRGKAEGWSYYLSEIEVVYEILVRLVAAALAGFFLASVVTAGIAPFLWYFKSWRERLADWATKAVVIAVLFVLSRYALIAFIEWATGNWGVRESTPTSHTLTLVNVLLVAFYVMFAIALFIPRSREQLVTSLDGVLSEKMTRRTALATVVGAAGVVATEYALSKRLSTVKAALPTLRPKKNILLISFDALAAEDMSLYGRGLPTTPNIDAFARKSTVFTRFFSASTFTTPSIATMLTGLYPSESLVYQLQGRLNAEDAEYSVPHLLRAAGYATGAFLSNPFAYFLATGVESGFDVLPEPNFRKGASQDVWNAIWPLHQESGFGSRVVEYFDFNSAWRSLGLLPPDPLFRLRPEMSFDQTRQILDKLPDGYFLWVHVMAPHNPYVPDVQDRGRFLPDSELQSYENESWQRWWPHYDPSQQSAIDRRRLGYDEYVATADRAFGTFMSDLESSGKLQNTAVIVSADHGESFEGGVYQHESPYQTRPVIHVPLIIRTPGQQDGCTSAFTADQTALAPTILELAGQPKPDRMRGHSLVEWLGRDGQGQGQGLAFSQYLETNSIFKPVQHGSVGVIDGDFQYVVYLDEQRGKLRPLREAHVWDLDRSAEYPEQARELRAALRAQFPDLVQAG